MGVVRRLAVVLALALAASCGDGEAPATRAAEPVPVAAPPAVAEREPVEIAIEHLRPAFERETVIRLNAIVSRSLETVRAYDASIAEVRAARDSAAAADAPASAHAAARALLGDLAALDRRAQAALADMRRAVAALEASGERYNGAILAGMVDFVEDVATEIRRERERLAARPDDGPDAG